MEKPTICARIMGVLATLAATLLFVGTIVGVAGPLFHFGLVYAERLGEGLGWIAPGWLVRHAGFVWWSDGIFIAVLALAVGLYLFPRLLAADDDLERPDG